MTESFLEKTASKFAAPYDELFKCVYEDTSGGIGLTVRKHHLQNLIFELSDKYLGIERNIDDLAKDQAKAQAKRGNVSNQEIYKKRFGDLIERKRLRARELQRLPEEYKNNSMCVNVSKYIDSYDGKPFEGYLTDFLTKEELKTCELLAPIFIKMSRSGEWKNLPEVKILEGNVEVNRFALKALKAEELAWRPSRLLPEDRRAL